MALQLWTKAESPHPRNYEGIGGGDGKDEVTRAAITALEGELEEKADKTQSAYRRARKCGIY